LLGDLLLLVARVVDGRPIAQSAIIALAIQRARIVDLEEELQDLAVADPGWVKQDLDRLGMGAAWR
jgi:hypothetical protein